MITNLFSIAAPFDKMLDMSKFKRLEWIFEGDCIRCTSHSARVGTGYPVIRRNGRYMTIARRIATRRHGELSGEIDTRHTCDNRWCINPAHVLIGTRSDNVRDMDRRGRRGRGPKGEEIGTSKLTENDVRAIRMSNERVSVLGRRYRVTVQAIYLIQKRKNWRHVQ